MSADFAPAVVIEYFSSYTVYTPGILERVDSFDCLDREKQDTAEHREAQRLFAEFADSAAKYGRVAVWTEHRSRNVEGRYFSDLGFDTEIIAKSKLLITGPGVALTIIKGGSALILERIKQRGLITIKIGDHEINVSNQSDLEAAVRAVGQLALQHDTTVEACPRRFARARNRAADQHLDGRRGCGPETGPEDRRDLSPQFQVGNPWKQSFFTARARGQL
jgi:hypothetical protein